MLHFEESFFEGEERDGFYIEPLMKKAWAAHLEVLYVIDEICARHNITYYADWGTLLGAVRHKGYIPWDDDLDIAMKRLDYERFLKIAEKELPKEWDILTIDKCSEWDKYLARVINTQVVPLPKSEMQKYHGFPYAAGVDIFAIDNMPADAGEMDTYIQLFKVVYYLAQTWEQNDMAENMEALKDLEEFCNMKFTEDKSYKHQLWILADWVASMYWEQGGDTKELTQTFMLADKPDFRIPASCYDSVVRVPFENIMIPIPVGYDKILSTYYGDYMTPVRGEADHEYPFYKMQREAFYEQCRENGVEIPESVRKILGE